MLQVALILLAAGSALAVITLNPLSFLRLPGRSGRYAINNGAADAVTYDPNERIAYVIGSRQDVLHVIDVLDDDTPVILKTHEFNVNSDGVPLDVSICRSGNVGRLAISFANRAATQPGHIQLFTPLTRTNLNVVPFEEITVDPDPKSIQWDADCQRIVMASEGLAGKLNNEFTDPSGAVDIIVLSPTGSVSRIRVDFRNSDLSKARQVYRDANNPTYMKVQDLEPENIAIDVNNNIYVTLEENNAIAKISLDVPSTPELFWQGVKNWNQYDVDTSANDNNITMIRRNVRSFFQSSDIDAFQFNGTTYLLTADTGAVKRYTTATHGVNFAESIVARSIPNDQLNMDAGTINEFKNVLSMGNLEVSQLHQPTDGWDDTFGGFDNLHAYGGRGWSIWRASDMRHIFDSGSDLEYYAASSQYRNVFNADVSNLGVPPPSTMDSRSDDKGPEPTQVAHTMFNGKHVVIVGSGRTGIIYVYTLLTIGGLPSPQFESVVRVGGTGDTWTNLYNSNNCGTPFIKDIVVIDHGDHMDVAVVGSMMGALQVFALADI